MNLLQPSSQMCQNCAPTLVCPATCPLQRGILLYHTRGRGCSRDSVPGFGAAPAHSSPVANSIISHSRAAIQLVGSHGLSYRQLVPTHVRRMEFHSECPQHHYLLPRRNPLLDMATACAYEHYSWNNLPILYQPRRAVYRLHNMCVPLLLYLGCHRNSILPPQQRH